MYHFGVSAVKVYFSQPPLRRNFMRVVYVPFRIQILEQSELQSLHINVVHVPL